jgi:3-isopropylmalate/(R)-2-methylmalate dehydratase small subunit
LPTTGFARVIAPSYADIFFNNCYKNGLLPIVLTKRGRAAVPTRSRRFPGSGSTIDLERQTVATPDGSATFKFDVEPFRKHCLLNGLDEIGLTLTHAAKSRVRGQAQSRATVALLTDDPMKDDDGAESDH